MNGRLARTGGTTVGHEPGAQGHARAQRVVVATGNAGKVRELGAALAPLGWQLVAQGELGIGPAAETSATFVENALAKARHAAAASGLPAIAEDSGLVVPALAGAPGVRSARFAGEGASDAANNAKLLAALAGVDARGAFFYCALVCVTHPADPTPRIAFGQWHGTIARAPRGRGGFGYDPYFQVPALGKTAAELTVAEKNRCSHRGRACRALVAELAAGP